mmetsp:Transcript_20414/g.40829  ORF Transcript_20414/g.40829 Transcript_20414/m.40829 type:complete len:252 (-) Transcript_20414:574-1329(-)
MIIPRLVRYIPPKTDVTGAMDASTAAACGLERSTMPAKSAPLSRLSSTSSVKVAMVRAYATMLRVNSSEFSDLATTDTRRLPPQDDTRMKTSIMPSLLHSPWPPSWASVSGSPFHPPPSAAAAGWALSECSASGSASRGIMMRSWVATSRSAARPQGDSRRWAQWRLSLTAVLLVRARLAETMSSSVRDWVEPRTVRMKAARDARATNRYRPAKRGWRWRRPERPSLGGGEEDPGRRGSEPPPSLLLYSML